MLYLQLHQARLQMRNHTCSTIVVLRDTTSPMSTTPGGTGHLVGEDTPVSASMQKPMTNVSCRRAVENIATNW